MSQLLQPRRDAGASAVEYSLIAVAIAAVIALLVVALGGYTAGTYKKTCDEFAKTGVTGSATCP